MRRKVGTGKRRRTVYTHPTKRTRRKSKRKRRRKRNPAHYKMNPRRRKRSRRRNPAGVGGFLKAVPQVSPIRVPLGGILGDVANGIVNGVFAGTLVFGGYLLSGVGVDIICTRADAREALAAGDNFKGKWLRPLLFAVSAGLTGTVFAMVAPKSKKATWSLLAAAGPGIRAAAGTIQNLIAPDATGAVAEVRMAAVGLADYLQVEGGGETGTVEDYLQVEDDFYEAGMGDFYEAGLGQEEEEVIGI